MVDRPSRDESLPTVDLRASGGKMVLTLNRVLPAAISITPLIMEKGFFIG